MIGVWTLKIHKVYDTRFSDESKLFDISPHYTNGNIDSFKIV